jgi:ribosomal protein S18 acetylase RimI-like enzyme
MDDTMNEQTLNLTGAPALDGLVFRPFRGGPDCANILTIINASRDADGVEDVETLESIRNNYEHLTNCDPRRDVVLVEADGRPVAYSRSFWMKLRAPGWIYIHLGHVVPEWRHKGIGRAMLRYHEDRLRQAARQHPEDGPKCFQTFSYQSEKDRVSLLESEGYRPARYFYLMVRPDLEDIPDLRLPPGLEVRPVQPEHIPHILGAAKEAFGDHWGEEEYGEEDEKRFLGSPEYAPDIWKVAWDASKNEVAGMVLGYILEAHNAKFNRKRGWTENISVRRPYRRQGVARALMAENLRELKARGMTEAALGVDTENPTGALRVYESMGFRPVAVEVVYRKPVSEG